MADSDGKRPAPERVLIIRLSAIGDVVMASPLIEAFRRTWPGVKISWLVEERSKAVLEANPGLEELVVWPRRRWRKLLREGKLLTLVKEAASLVSRLRSNRYDLAVDVQGLLKSGIWARLSGAKERIGLGSKEGSGIFMTRVIERPGSSDRLSSQYLKLARELGLDAGDFPMEVAVGPEAEGFAEQFAGELPGPYAVLCPFTTRPQKHWFEERWRELSLRIIEELGLSAVVLGGPGDREAAGRLLPDDAPLAINLAGRTDIGQAAAIIARSSLLVGVDTGLTHMGIALNVPTIALFGATRPYLDTSGTSGTVLYHPMECSPCRRDPTCDDDFTCMKAITTEEVFRAALVARGNG